MKTFIIDGQKINVTFQENKFGVWQYTATCNGKRVRKPTKQRTLRLAEDILQEDLPSIVKATAINNGLSLDDIWQAYLDTPRASTPGKERLQAYQQKIIDFIQFATSTAGISHTNKITEDLTKQYIQHIRASSIGYE